MSTSSLKLIITGASGMVGEGVLHEALLRADVAEVLVVGRRSCGVVHPKLKEIVHPDFFDITHIRSQLESYDGCLFCLGVSSVGMKEAEYTRLTHTLTLHFAQTLCEVNAGAIFCYISGAGTDSSGKGRSMWARVKGRTENDLLRLPFRKVFAFRPAMLTPTPGLHNTLKIYHYLGWLAPVLRTFFPNAISTLRQLGNAMINAVKQGYDKSILEVKDIKQLANAAV